jgi:hypothetical protein
LSFSSTGTPKSGPSAVPAVRAASAARTSFIASGLTAMTLSATYQIPEQKCGSRRVSTGIQPVV